MNSDYDVRTLNSLIETTIDSVDGYRSAATEADNSQFQAMFFERANERELVVNDLTSQVRTFGGDPSESGTIVAGAHRMFMGLRDAISGRDDTAVIAEVERGEDHIKAAYERALADQDVSASAREAIARNWQSIKSGHDQMSNLKHALAG